MDGDVLIKLHRILFVFNTLLYNVWVVISHSSCLVLHNDYEDFLVCIKVDYYHQGMFIV